MGFFGLLYAILGSKPEMVADSNLRVVEPPLRSPSAVLQSANLGKVDSIPAPELNNEVLLYEGEEFVTDNSVQEVEPESLVESAPVNESATLADVAEEDEYLSPIPLLETIVVLDDDAGMQLDMTEDEITQSVSELSTTDVSVIAGSDEFINLNLVETKPIEMVLIEGDDLILDDVNEGLSKFTAVVDTFAEKPALEPVATITFYSVSVTADDVAVSSVVMPDIDRELITGSDKVSLEYQATMKKLFSVKQQMAEADAENARLKAKFSSVVDQNRELAILIRDIDVKIKTLTASN
ncbi:hypothetical protein DKT75_02255 [Leucothrix arctica]|uniref:Uncharacterized protein n=1 Tax=Leucothrix arctica TaxID=1481894 RepID=A0A317CRE5_9GAMM|nr:hypothetical protein DKT75_02255 [Leucothrix arctica]